MFFKPNSKINEKSINVAFQSTFTFWGFTLLVNALFEMAQDKPLISNSFVILFVGLAIFFLTEQIANYFSKNRN
ncbi:hypothetical protein [Psychrobacillus sp.]|uniref:hypothetical protein n=1 Tax=Psychrobacillus sp. TaxID=1871623 RepID=UPI0028BF047E|nr:hypothetical protein [Psychrobacillus sp.]